ncbi:MAG TPA: hypothetical protein VET87_04800 [Rubrivivax sp.]|nr:hypothetical protein [Rubrivivax sp.]
MSETTVLYIILGAVVVLFVAEKVLVVLVALGTAVALYFTGILTANEAVTSDLFQR